MTARRRSLRVAGLAMLGLVAAFTVQRADAATEPAQSPAAATGRLAGETRYDTAVAISRATFAPHASEMVLARGDKFPDALVGSFVVSIYYGLDGPVLLTPPDQLPAAVRDEIARLSPYRVWIIGGEGAVSAGIEREVRSLGAEVVRLAGQTRYDNAYLAATEADQRTTSFVVSGENFADAVTVGPLASRNSIPIVLTTHDTLAPGARDALRQQNTSQVVIVGGTSAVSEEVANEIRAMRDGAGQQLEVTRIAGRNRQETATRVADFAMRPGPYQFSVRHVNLVRGDAFPDAVAAGPHGGVEEAVTLLTASATDLGPNARTWLQANAASIDSIHALGDTSVVSDPVLDDAARAAGG